ncbi:Survival protein surA [Moritella viscosa]|uniref:peptidylprolyl isomerase SurA n=1 Tax=Moritella viscosa TaxID=80854 RepID=UPI000509009F|nr:peptidylprolyl isomerase SurA [Moritella viscosa]CED61713.1 chaperone SurA precursor [Moritella viscosa]SHO05658.1 Survival protein surA [Moritella viscosa]SHO05673.1 Survival protein surA [Moritella viscosa]SHO06550.1 Survival protein surA [Moritella viscosa]SHO08995.1 Survival protein surA [Moritella viscosa]
MIKKVIKILLSGVIVVTSWQAQAELTKLDEVIAIVNEEVILASDVNTLTSSVTKRATKAGQTLPSQKILTQQALDKLIIDSLQLQMAKKMGMRISNAQLDDTLNNIAKSNNQTVEQLRQNVLADGGNFNDYKEELRVQLLTNEVQRMQMRRRITISDQDVDNLLAIINEQGQKNLQYRVSHIMLRVPNDADNATMEALQTKITDIQTQLNAGKEFSNLALAVSAGPKALDGGDWGWMNINEMPTLFAEAVTNAKKGDIIGPIRSGAGLHIIKITDMRGVETVLTKEVNARHILVKPSVILSDDKARSLLNGYLARIKSGDADFAELAKAYSDDTGSAVKGGELGWADPNIYVPAFKLALKDLKKGEISPAFRSSHGWHIVQLLDRRTQDTTDKANRQKAWQLLYNRRAAEESQAWLNELKQEAYIRILDNES